MPAAYSGGYWRSVKIRENSSRSEKCRVEVVLSRFLELTRVSTGVTVSATPEGGEAPGRRSRLSVDFFDVSTMTPKEGRDG